MLIDNLFSLFLPSTILSFIPFSDFGLATEMKDDRMAYDDLYCFTGMTGSPRYMSPGKFKVCFERKGGEKIAIDCNLLHSSLAMRLENL